MQTEFFRLEVLTPVHIGTGEEIDPMAYLMREEETGPACHILDTRAWATEYPDPEALCAKFSGGNVPQMRKFLADAIDPVTYGVRRIAVTDPGIYREYIQKRDDQRTTHQLLLSPQMSGDGRSPAIPGSSLKGALRTAVIDWLDREQGLQLKANLADYGRKLELALGRITESAFKQLKVGDVAGYADSTILVEALEIRRKEGKQTTPKNKCEAIPGQVLGTGKGTTLYGRLALGNALSGSRRLVLPSGKSWDWPELCRLVNAYLLPRLDAELTRFYCQPQFAKARPVAQEIRRQLAEAAEGQMYLRVGHYSQVEFVTVRDNKPFTKMGKDGKPIPHGTTRTLANGLYPFGWVRITPCSEEEYRQGQADREETDRQALASRLDRRRAIADEKARVLAEKQAEEQRARQAEKEAARRQAEEEARRADLPPLERSILEAVEADPDPNKRPWATLLGALKQGRWEGEEARVVAGRIKEGMIADNKWKETTSKKNPNKDHDYQKTLEVLKFMQS